MITLYTDGGCNPNPGPGAWAVVLPSPLRVFTGYHHETTNNRMEMMAFIRATQLFEGSLTIFSDSEYVVQGFSSWMHAWAKRRWRRKGSPIPNADLWQHIYFNIHPHRQILAKRVPGHSGHHWNETADQACEDAMRRRRGSEDNTTFHFPVPAPAADHRPRKRLEQACLPHMMASKPAGESVAAHKHTTDGPSHGGPPSTSNLGITTPRSNSQPRPGSPREAASEAVDRLHSSTHTGARVASSDVIRAKTGSTAKQV